MTTMCYIRRKILVVIGVFTSLGLLTGMVTPWWVVVVTSDSRLVNGLWYTLTCDVSTGMSLCESTASIGDSSIGNVRLEYGLLTLFGAVLCTLGTFFLVIYNPREDTIRSTLTGCLTLALYIITALLTWIAVGKAIADNIRLNKGDELDVPWSLIVSAISATVPVFLIVAISFRVHNNVINIKKEEEQKKKTQKFYEQRSCHSSTTMLGNTLQSNSIHSSMPSLDISFSNHHEVNSLNSLTLEFKEDIIKSPIFPADTIPFKFPGTPP